MCNATCANSRNLNLGKIILEPSPSSRFMKIIVKIISIITFVFLHLFIFQFWIMHWQKLQLISFILRLSNPCVFLLEIISYFQPKWLTYRKWKNQITKPFWVQKFKFSQFDSALQCTSGKRQINESQKVSNTRSNIYDQDPSTLSEGGNKIIWQPVFNLKTITLVNFYAMRNLPTYLVK